MAFYAKKSKKQRSASNMQSYNTMHKYHNVWQSQISHQKIVKLQRKQTVSRKSMTIEVSKVVVTAQCAV